MFCVTHTLTHWSTCHNKSSQFKSHSPGEDMLLSSCFKDSPVNMRISSCSRRWPSRVRCQKQDFLLPSLHIWLQVLRKLLLKHRLCLMVFFQPSGAVWKKGKCSLGTEKEQRSTPGASCGARCSSSGDITHVPLRENAGHYFAIQQFYITFISVCEPSRD